MGMAEDLQCLILPSVPALLRFSENRLHSPCTSLLTWGTGPALGRECRGGWRKSGRELLWPTRKGLEGPQEGPNQCFGDRGKDPGSGSRGRAVTGKSYRNDNDGA